MIFWDIEALKLMIIRDKFSETQRFYYFLLTLTFMFFILTLWQLGVFKTSVVSSWQQLEAFATFVIYSAGTFLAYRANGGEHGKDFVSRFVAIHLVCSIRLLPIFTILLFSAEFFNHALIAKDDVLRIEQAMTPFDALSLTVANLLLFVLLIRHLNQVARQCYQRELIISH